MDYRGRVDFDLNSPRVEQWVRQETEQVAMRARAFAPVDSGDLRASIGFTVERHSGAKRDRVVGVVFTNAHAADGSGYGASAEYGTSESRGSYFLRRALLG